MGGVAGAEHHDFNAWVGQWKLQRGRAQGHTVGLTDRLDALGALDNEAVMAKLTARRI